MLALWKTLVLSAFLLGNKRRDRRSKGGPPSEFKNVRHCRSRREARVYVESDVYTNTVESACSLLKRGIVGAFHKG